MSEPSGEPRRTSPATVSAVAVVVLLCALGACKTAPQGGPPEAPSAPPGAPPPLPVKTVDEELVVAAWSEPKELPQGGGQAQILVRVQHRGGAAYPGVEVRLSTSAGV